MAKREFNTWRDYHKFSFEVRRRSRYVFSAEVKGFLGAVEDSLPEYETTIYKDKALYRAQLGFDIDECYDSTIDDTFELEIPLPKEKMVPPEDHPFPGRTNPAGILCLYLATSPKTAMSELRPWLGGRITLATFRTMKTLTLVDCTRSERSSHVFLENPPPEVRNSKVWSDLNNAFSTPTNPDRSAIEYVPTQIVAELFKSKGYDGIVYKSRYGDGLNVALFSLGAAEPEYATIHRVTRIDFEFDEGGEKRSYKDVGKGQDAPYSEEP